MLEQIHCFHSADKIERVYEELEETEQEYGEMEDFIDREKRSTFYRSVLRVCIMQQPL